MAAFQRFLDPAAITATTLKVTFPDPLLETGGLSRFARYPMRPLSFMVAQPNGSPNFSFRWPVNGTVRLVDLLPADAAALGVSELIELSPLPFIAPGVLRSLAVGLPTFYIGLVGATLPDHDGVVRTSDPAFNVTRAVVGCIFQDRMTLEPWAWIGLISRALEQSSPSDAADWQTLAAIYEGQRSLQVRDPAGFPADNQPFRVRFLDTQGGVIRSADLTSDAAGNLGQAAFPQPGERAEISWNPEPLVNDEALPVMAIYEECLADPTDDAARAIPGETPLILPSGFNGGHLQLLDLARWYAPIVVSPGKPWPARFRAHSHVEPLVDGVITYTKLVEDIRRASGIHLAGWMFDEFAMRLHDPDTSLVKLMDSIGRDKFRLLITKSFNPKVGALDGVGVEGLVALMMLMVAFEPLIATENLGAFSDRGFMVWHAAVIAVVVALIVADPDSSVEEKIRKAAEFTKERTRKLLYDVSDGKFQCAFPSPHPVALRDNPISHDFSIPGASNLSDIQELWGVYHQKMQVLEIPSGAGATYVGYLGGVDINSNRLDSPGHHAARHRQPDSTGPPVAATYHDVHARITGPAALDVVGIFHERFEHAMNFQPTGVVQEPLFIPPPPPPAPQPTPAFQPPTLPPEPAGQHLARVAQTSFRPGTGSVGFPWSPNGDAPIRETFERAIRSAREYIYIEEQYFTLDNGLIALLRQAADRCRRLVIVVPSGTPDQIFGDERRLATFERLAGSTGGPGGWGDRMVVGTPFRRPALPAAERHASIGRASLLEEVTSSTASKIFVGPVMRVPQSAPYFFWVAGELMYATKARKVTSPSGQPATELEILRGNFQGTQNPFCPTPRTHKKGAPVTFGPPKAIFVHAKLLMVDDMFVAIGSSNWNRRGFYHDGEADVFVIPDRLKAARDNPAFKLRTALWAEHLGLTPEMGQSLLADPVEAFELFRRSRYQGNRFCDYREFLGPRGDLEALNDFELFQLIPDSLKTTLIATANAFALTQIKNIWNTVTDATTGVDPNPTEGPELP